MPRAMPVSVRARLPTSSGVAEQHGQARAGGALVAAALPGVADLAEDLALAEHGGVEAGGTEKRWATAAVVVVGVEVVGEGLGGRGRSARRGTSRTSSMAPWYRSATA